MTDFQEWADEPARRVGRVGWPLGQCATGSPQPGCRPIFDDHEATRGFLHRLDVPSSGWKWFGDVEKPITLAGLILAASSYAAYYDLRIQLAHGYGALNGIKYH